MTANDPTSALAGSDLAYGALLTKVEDLRRKRTWPNNLTIAISSGSPSYTLQDDDDLLVINSDGTNGTIDLPSDLSEMLGRRVGFKATTLNSATISITPGGATKIDGVAGAQDLDADYEYFELVVGKTAEWVICADRR